MYVTEFDSGLVDVAAAGTTTIYTSDSDIGLLPFGGTMIVEITNGDAAQALDAFTLNIKAHPTSSYQAYLSSWTEDAETVPFRSADPSTLAADTVAIAIIKLHGACAFQFTASSASAGQADNCRVRGRIIAPAPS